MALFEDFLKIPYYEIIIIINYFIKIKNIF
jgi:hypothetical protein